MTKVKQHKRKGRVVKTHLRKTKNSGSKYIGRNSEIYNPGSFTEIARIDEM